jgi:putative oxidoreductase
MSRCSTTSRPALSWFAGILEIVGGPLILIGLCTRPVAFLLSGMMAIPYFQISFSGGADAVAQPGRARRDVLLRVPVLRRCGRRRISVDAMRSRTSS